MLNATHCPRRILAMLCVVCDCCFMLYCLSILHNIITTDINIIIIITLIN